MTKNRRGSERKTFYYCFVRFLSFLLLLPLCIATLPACGNRVTRHVASSFDYFDTYSEIILYTSDEGSFDAFCRLVWEELDICHRLFDIYSEYDGVTNLKTVNDHAGMAPVCVDARILDLLELSLQMYEKTNGKTNIALGSVLRIWHDYREAGISVPGEDELLAAAEHTDIRQLILDRVAGTVFFADPALRLDVGAIAKGFALGRVYAALRDAGYTDFCLNIGGSVYCSGVKPGGDPWRIAVEDPSGTDNYAATVSYRDRVLVTSGDYQRYYEMDGVRYCHIMDPGTLYPARYFSAVSVLADDAAVADALSTALFCMTREDGLALLSHFEGYEALWITSDGTLFRTEGFPGQ